MLYRRSSVNIEEFAPALAEMVSTRRIIATVLVSCLFLSAFGADSSVKLLKASLKVTHVQDGEKMHRAWVSTDAETISQVGSVEGFTALGSDSISVQASFVGDNDEPASIHQPFLRFVNKRTGADNLFLLKRRGREMKADIKLRTEIKADHRFWTRDDVYAVELVMGDLKLAPCATWTITENMRLAEDSTSLFEQTSGGVFDFDVGIKKEILPEFSSPIPDAERRASIPLIVAALVGVLIPLPLLLIAWNRLGVFPLRFPVETGEQLWLFGFETCMVGHLFALVMFWLQWNIVTTWKVLGSLMIPTLFFGRKVLSASEKER